jgi:hypothetical protein
MPKHGFDAVAERLGFDNSLEEIEAAMTPYDRLAEAHMYVTAAIGNFPDGTPDLMEAALELIYLIEDRLGYVPDYTD